MRRKGCCDFNETNEIVSRPQRGISRCLADLKSHLIDSRLPSTAHENFIQPISRYTNKNEQLPAQYTVFRSIHTSLDQLEEAGEI